MRLLKVPYVLGGIVISFMLASVDCQPQPFICRRDLDVVGVIDGSDSITDIDFDLLKQSLTEFAQLFLRGAGNRNFGAVIYSSSISDVADLSSHLPTLEAQIQAFVHPQDGTHTHLGIQRMIQMLARPTSSNVTKIGVVITDGRSKFMKETQDAAAAARAAGITMYAIGVGNFINQAELESIASSDRNVYGIEDFRQLYEAVDRFVQALCVIDGGWGDWIVANTTRCSQSCGGGTQTVTSIRFCNNPVPAGGGKPCEGASIRTYTKTCNVMECEVCPDLDVVAVVDGSDSIVDRDFNLLKMSLKDFARMLFLGEGQRRFGAVVYSSLVSDVAALSSNLGNLNAQIDGFVHPQDGTYTNLGIQRMSQMLNGFGRNNVAKIGMVITDGRSKDQALTLQAAEQAKRAGIKMLAIGIGQRINEAELNGIASAPDMVKILDNFDELYNLIGDFVQVVCRVDGNWTQWFNTDVTCCADTTRTRTVTQKRTCTNPPPSRDGRFCQGPSTRTFTETCSTNICKVDGNWTQWFNTDVTCCADTTRTRTVTQRRTCTNPPPSSNGNFCQGPSTRTFIETCNTNICKVDGNWTQWFNTDVTCCADATRTRTVTQRRTCTNPPPSSNGNFCQGPSTRTFIETCNTNICKVDGNWTQWFNTDVTCCADATRTRTVTQRRTCTNPPPSSNGNFCQGPSTRTFTETCNTDICKVDGNWTQWFNTNVTCCADATRTRIVTQRRTCTNPPPSSNGNFCQGPSTRTFIETCNTNICKVDGNWTQWFNTNVTCCADATRTRTVTQGRTCTNPPPSSNGNFCQGPSTRTFIETCNTNFCTVTGRWNPWVEVHATCCDNGVQTVTDKRTCTDPTSSGNFIPCVGSDTRIRTRICSTNNCPEDPCDGCIFVNGIAYLIYPSDRRKFIQCDIGGQYHVKDCPPGFVWSQVDLTCKEGASVIDICNDITDIVKTGYLPYPNQPSKYIYCVNGEFSFRVCDEGLVWEQASLTCIKPVCDKTSVSGSATQYKHGSDLMTCAPGTQFNVDACRCVHGTSRQNLVQECVPEVHLPFTRGFKDESGRYTAIDPQGVAIRDGYASFSAENSSIRILRFSNMDFLTPLVISFAFRPGSRFALPQALVTNADCDKNGTIYIYQTSTHIVFTVYNKANAAFTLSIPYDPLFFSGSDWTNVRLTVVDGVMTASVGTIVRETEFIAIPSLKAKYTGSTEVSTTNPENRGEIGKSHYALQIGRGTGYNNFRGDLDDFFVYLCVPEE